ncbi:MAG: hypothetical protein ACREIC_13665, partial [Limisphaerales bacterium]
MKTHENVTQWGGDSSTHLAKSAHDVRPFTKFLRFLSRILAALVLLVSGLFCGFGFLASFEPGNGLAWRVVYGALTCCFLSGAFALGRCAMKNSAQRFPMADPTSPGLRSWIWGALALVAIDSARCNGGTPDPLLASGEQALIGSYKLDNVLLAPAKLVVLPNSDPLFKDMGDSPEQAAQKGLLNPTQLAVLKRQDCALTILADYSFVITNLPSADLTRTFTVKGTWSMRVYHVFDTYGYRISLNCVGYQGLHAKFISADKPSLPILEIFSGAGKQSNV